MIFKKIAISGACGFVGTNLFSALNVSKQYLSIGFGNFSNYYDVKLKEDRVAALLENTREKVLRWDLRGGVRILVLPLIFLFI